MPNGTVTRTVPHFSCDFPPTLTAHDVGIKDLLALFYMFNDAPQVVLYATTIDPRQPIRLHLSAQVRRAAEQVVAQIAQELAAATSAHA